MFVVSLVHLRKILGIELFAGMILGLYVRGAYHHFMYGGAFSYRLQCDL